MTARQVGDGNADGLQLPDTKVGFFGATPVAQQTAITTLATTPTATDIATAVNSIITALSNLGLTA